AQLTCTLLHFPLSGGPPAATGLFLFGPFFLIWAGDHPPAFSRRRFFYLNFHPPPRNEPYPSNRADHEPLYYPSFYGFNLLLANSARPRSRRLILVSLDACTHGVRLIKRQHRKKTPIRSDFR